jgi:hypothetical protein
VTRKPPCCAALVATALDLRWSREERFLDVDRLRHADKAVHGACCCAMVELGKAWRTWSLESKSESTLPRLPDAWLEVGTTLVIGNGHLMGASIIRGGVGGESESDEGE